MHTPIEKKKELLAERINPNRTLTSLVAWFYCRGKKACLLPPTDLVTKRMIFIRLSTSLGGNYHDVVLDGYDSKFLTPRSLASIESMDS